VTNDELGAALVAATAARADDDAERLIRYARRETPTGDAGALDAFADVLAADAAALGATARRLALPSGDALLVEHPGAGERSDLPPALLLAHHDTVHPVGSLNGAVPLRRDGDALHGPGVYDMKGGLVVVLGAWAALAATGAPARPARLLVTPDEEIGSPTGGPLVVQHATEAAYTLGLEPPHPDGALKTSRRGSARWRLSVTGRAAHAALDPGAGVSAIDELVDQLLAVRAVAAEFPDVLVNVGVIAGGGRTNVVPDSASADVGLRFVDGRTEEAFLARLAALAPVRAGAAVTPQVITRRPAWGPAAAAESLLAAVARAGALVGQAVSGRAAAGAADTNLTGAAGVPSLDGFGPLGGGAHAATEHVLLSSIPWRAALLAATLATV
jgi:glutamate carboxypeptidase